MNGSGSKQAVNDTERAGDVGRRGGGVRRRQDVDRRVAGQLGEVHDEASAVRERDKRETRARVEADDERLAEVEDTNEVRSTYTRRRVHRKYDVHRLTTYCVVQYVITVIISIHLL